MPLDEINEKINRAMAGLPFPLVVTRLLLITTALCEELETAGRDVGKILDQIIDDEQPQDDPDPDLGPCCTCEKIGRDVRNSIMLDKRCVVAGHGWGCFLCGLPCDGASYVQCDSCLEGKRPPIYACRGYPGKEGRIDIKVLTAPFEHDMAKHPEDV